MTRKTIGVLLGSLSAHSINQRLRLAIERSGARHFDFTPIGLADLPLYNRDADSALPAPVERLKAEVLAADGLLIVSPEYNRSVPSALKNALDWGSRPYGRSAWKGKKAAIAGASSGNIGTAVAQSHLRAILTHLDILALPQPELYVRVTDALIAEDGTVHDPDFAALLDRFTGRFAELLG